MTADLQSFEMSLKLLIIRNIVHISMDVNLKFLGDLKAMRMILHFGTRNLRIVHCAFKATIMASSGNSEQFLRALNRICLRIHQQGEAIFPCAQSGLFPLKLCAQ